MSTIVRPSGTHALTPSHRSTNDPPLKRKKERQTDTWSSLLRQTREAQARNRTQAVQHRELILCGGSPDDQRTFIQSLARPPPPAPPSRNRDTRPQKAKGQLTLSNRFAYGYGHVTLYSPPHQNTGMLGGEAEEAAHLEVHTLPEPDMAYEPTLRRLLKPKQKKSEAEPDDDAGFAGGNETYHERGRRPAVSILLSWKEPWRFLGLLRRWLQLLAAALLPPNSPLDRPLEVLKEHALAFTVIVQYVEAQEGLEREGYKEDTFDYVAQCLRTCMLPLSAALVYTSSLMPPQPPGSALSEIQKVLFTSLNLDLGPLSPAPPKGIAPAKRLDLALKHNVVDRMAIVVPSGWDSAGKIRLLSENFSPESVLEAWDQDLQHAQQQRVDHSKPQPAAQPEPEDEHHTNGGAEEHVSAVPQAESEQEVYATSDAGEEDPELAARPLSPSKQSLSAIAAYEAAILDPNAHKAPKPPRIEVTTKPDQQFLTEMRAHLQALEAEDAKRATASTSTAAGALHSTSRMIGLPTGEQTGALNELVGDVSFNVGGVSYNTVSAEAVIERLKRPPPPSGFSSPAASRNVTPRPPRREDKEASATPARSGSGGSDVPIDQLAEYFASLARKGGEGGGSRQATPSKPPTAR
ncbi:hypothetical protein BAUCODRAFT_124818 [Baudoinia panamericana UAMH 10762]|uniref:Dynein light intermediate chain n=1 Tax=Baudoinia panamericana (strain UAMH 10762) TaxID=717646 RepID=M2MRJ5_BAUPA|nr:uncharacterized protein BAUCODRAFT_124818 [Baudoinia panamericana UAMH 10762]EMC94088.1 hypothetical protein BAUCODRAFT_124818 [Baudoinia panamericana UAMH 10762]